MLFVPLYPSACPSLPYASERPMEEVCASLSELLSVRVLTDDRYITLVPNQYGKAHCFALRKG